jgi:hypothetical protein
MSKKEERIKPKINKIGITKDTITGRGGLIYIVKYLQKINLLKYLATQFGFLRKSKKGISLINFFKQLICYFIDGTSFSLSFFDELKRDYGYAEIIEEEKEALQSSHAVKRFFNKFTGRILQLFRKVLLSLFIWRLTIEKPERIILGVDTMVLDNNEAKKREGVEPTYKKVLGYQPLQITWGKYVVDMLFRPGSYHSNHGDDLLRVIKKIVKYIRKRYSNEVPIIVRADAGFFSEENFKCFNKLDIGFIVCGKMYEDVKKALSLKDDEEFQEFVYKGNSWYYGELDFKCKSWENVYRMIYVKPITEDYGQILLGFARPEYVMYTNLGQDNRVTKQLCKLRGWNNVVPAESVISCYHNRGADELVFRGIKDLGTEALPFKGFAQNGAFYYLMVIAYNIFEFFKKDIKSDIIPITIYASTFRRKFIDIACKIVHTGGIIIAKVTAEIFSRLKLPDLWDKINALKIPSFLSITNQIV